MPGDSLKKIEKGATSHVDAVIMDWEDGVALSQKEIARQTTLTALRTLDFGRSERIIRVNPASSPLFSADLTALASAERLDCVVLPKTEHPDQFQAIHDRFPALPIIGIIESGLGVVKVRSIAEYALTQTGLVGLAFGAEDYAGSIGATRTPGGLEVLYARSAVVAHAAAYGLQAIDTPYVQLQDEAGLIADTQFAAQLGYTGKFAIHPKQISVLENAFNPTESAIVYAQRVIAAHDDQQANGTGVFELDGKMIDMPMVRAAETVITRAKAAGLIALS
jgi:citrate lyase beta subunit